MAHILVICYQSSVCQEQEKNAQQRKWHYVDKCNSSNDVLEQEILYMKKL